MRHSCNMISMYSFLTFHSPRSLVRPLRTPPRPMLLWRQPRCWPCCRGRWWRCCRGGRGPSTPPAPEAGTRSTCPAPAWTFLCCRPFFILCVMDCVGCWDSGAQGFTPRSPPLYRVAHLIADLGWVELDLECSTVCPILLGLMGIRQKWLGKCVIWILWKQSQPNSGPRPDGPPCGGWRL